MTGQHNSCQLREMVTWQGFTGWEGIECHHCGATHNVMVGGGAMFCERCGERIVKSWNFHRRCFDNPDFGYQAGGLGFATFTWGRYRHLLKPTPEEAEHLKKVSAYMLSKTFHGWAINGAIEVGAIPVGMKFVYGATVYERTEAINDDGYVVCKGIRNWYGNPNCHDQAFPPDFDVTCGHIAMTAEEKKPVAAYQGV